MAKNAMPELIFISPIGKGRQKARYKHTLFSIEEWDADGRPRKLTMRTDDEVIDMQKISESGTEFMTGYVVAYMTAPHPDKKNKRAKP